MEKTTEDLMHEHKAILLALDIIEKMKEKVSNNNLSDHGDRRDMIGFLKVFADKCHHGKEEMYLFPALEEAGIRNQGGPIGVMLEEHRQGRVLIRQMENALVRDSIMKDDYVASAEGYINLLRNHIEKENKVLFPLSDATLSAAKQDELIREFERLEEEVIGKGVHEELHEMLKRFSKKYLV